MKALVTDFPITLKTMKNHEKALGFYCNWEIPNQSFRENIQTRNHASTP